MPVPEREFRMKHIIENVPDIAVNGNHTKSENHFNIPWQFQYTRTSTGYLSIFVYCLASNENKNWSIQTELNFKLISPGGNTFNTCFNCSFGNSSNHESLQWGWNEFIRWDKIEKYYMMGKKVTIEAHLKIKKTTGFVKEKLRNFDESNTEFSDIVLVVENQKFYVMKTFLSSQSSYFKSLLLGKFEESKQSEVVLNDLNAEDFQRFLELIHGEPAIHDNNIDGVLHLADMYDCPTAIRRCEEFLFEKSKWTLEEKLELSTRYNLTNLKVF